MEKVGTVIPTFNRSNWLQGAVQTAMAKQWDNMVVIVVDGNSTDNTPEVMKVLETVFRLSRNLIYIRRNVDGNIAEALNTGILKALELGCDYVEWCSDDDRHLPHKTSMQIQVFKNPPIKKLGLVYSGYNALWIDGPPEEGHRVTQTVRAIPQYYSDRKAQWDAIRKLCIINGSTIMVKAEVFDEVGLFDPKWMCAQDFEMWIRIQRSYNCFRIPTVLCNRYEHPKTLTNYVDANKLNEDIKLFEFIKDWQLEEV